MSKNIKKMYQDAGLKPPDGKGIHTKKFHECVIDVTKAGTADSPHAVCMKSIGREGAVRKSHRQVKVKQTPTGTVKKIKIKKKE